MADPVGRPTKYLPKYADQVIELMRKGYSMPEVAYELNVVKSTLYEWMEKHKDFSDAIKEGKYFSEGWWLRKGRKSLRDKEFSYTGWYMNMKNRFGWADKQETNVTATLRQEDALKELE
jgi:orotate phosphoribosyltransferase-like protein